MVVRFVVLTFHRRWQQRQAVTVWAPPPPEGPAPRAARPQPAAEEEEGPRRAAVA